MTDQCTVKVDALAYGGTCIGHVTEGEKSWLEMRAFVPGTVPGETVTVKITEKKKNHLKANLVEILESSPERISPPCPYFKACGGCSLQHIQLGYQRKLKADMIETMLSRQAGLNIKVELPKTDLPGYNYRNRISLHLNEKGELGFYREGTGEVVDIEECLLAEQCLNDLLREVRKHKDNLSPFTAAVSIEKSEDGIILVLKLRDQTNLPKGFSPVRDLAFFLQAFPNITITQREHVLFRQFNFKPVEEETSFHAGHFAQVNNYGNKLLIDAVLENCISSEITELYAGGGNFTIPLAKWGKSIEAVEISAALVENGKVKAQLENISDRITFHASSAEKYLKHNSLKEMLLLDPPRSGAKNIIRYCNPSQTKEIVYVSCNLPTLQRDLKELVGKGYQLTKMLMVDMFPQTHHVETISVLQR